MSWPLCSGTAQVQDNTIPAAISDTTYDHIYANGECVCGLGNGGSAVNCFPASCAAFPNPKIYGTGTANPGPFDALAIGEEQFCALQVTSGII